MDIDFKNEKLRKIFNSKKGLKKAYGKNAETIMKRMAFLSASANLSLVPSDPPFGCHPLKGDRKGQFAVYLKHPFRLVFTANHSPVPVKPDGVVDIARITAIKIINVEDYH